MSAPKAKPKPKPKPNPGPKKQSRTNNYVLPYMIEEGSNEIYFFLPVIKEMLIVSERTDYYTVNILGGKALPRQSSEHGALRELCEETIETITASPADLIYIDTLEVETPTRVTKNIYYGLPVRVSRDLIRTIAKNKQAKSRILQGHSKEDSFLYIFTAQQLAQHPAWSKILERKFRQNVWPRSQYGVSSIDKFEKHLRAKRSNYVIQNWDTIEGILPKLLDDEVRDYLHRHYHTDKPALPHVGCVIYK